MVPKDVLAVSTIGSVVASHDGKWVAIVVQRPMKPGESYQRDRLDGNDRADVWLARADGGSTENITHGERARSGFWEPVWSPDSKRLALFSTSGGDNVRLYLYDLTSRRLQRLTKNGLDLNLNIRIDKGNAGTVSWLDATHLLAGILPRGQRALSFDEDLRTSNAAAEGLARAMRGQIATANVLTTGETATKKSETSAVALTIIDVVSRREKVVTTLPIVDTRLSKRVVSIPASKEYAAIMVTDPPVATAPVRNIELKDLYPMRVGVVSLSERNNPRWISGLRPATFGSSANPSPVRWAPSGQEFAFLAVAEKSFEDTTPTPFTISIGPNQEIGSRRFSSTGSADLAANDIHWIDQDSLLVQGHPIGRQKDPVARARRDWWLITRNGSPRNVTGKLPTPPTQLLRSLNPDSLVVAAGNKLWTVDLKRDRITQLNPDKDMSPSRVIWPLAGDSTPSREMLVASVKGPEETIYLLNLNNDSAMAIIAGSVPRHALVREVSRSGDFVIYQTRDTRICLKKTSDLAPLTLLSLNRGQDEIAAPQYRSFEYQSTDGKPLSAALLLPHDYSPARRYPMIVSVYAGSFAPEGDWASPYTADYLNLMLLAGHGYAVLIPSMPLERQGIPSDPMQDLPQGVIPAVDKVVEMGIAHRDRIGLIGVSYGGYSVYGLITQSDRFKAAVALAGMTDLISYYGALDPRYRFSDEVTPFWAPFGAESQQMRMGTRPWEDPSRFLRNSPYLYADRVTTPLLIIHGTQDVVPVTQAEQFYVALARLNKKAKMIRYLGEGHRIQSPANILDMWQQIFGWLDQHLKSNDQG